MDGLAEVAVGVLHREVTEVQRVLRTAAELRNGAVELDVEVVEGHDQVIQERRREHDTERASCPRSPPADPHCRPSGSE